MDRFAAARAAARRWRAEALAANGGNTDPVALVTAGARLAGLKLHAVGDAEGCLRGADAVLDRDLDAIFYKASTPATLACLHQAHELGHFCMDGASAVCDAASLSLEAEEALPLGGARVENYSPKQHRECRANVFARTFVLPPEEARDSFIAGATAASIANALGVAETMVVEQLARGLLLPPDVAVEADAPAEAHSAPPPLDASQEIAAKAESGPVLLEAGPGTGKTRTLVARVEHLLASGVVPSEILILTFSNKAADELRERIGRAAPDAATGIWAGTFHSFGLELLRQYGHRIGLPADPRPIDANEAMGLLETLLPTLPLDHYLVLHDPTRGFAEMLTAISRAKDELVGPAGYRALAEAMPQGDPAADLARAKALEVAEIYKAYDAALAVAGRADFGDLIQHCCTLLAQHADVTAELQTRWPHILVDEFQDVNRASAVLLKTLAGEGGGLWVVGDARQSIYRFRGASPDNIRLFEQDYPTARRLVLAVNYRSKALIVDAFARFAAEMEAGAGTSVGWHPHAGIGAPVDFQIADGLDGETEGIAGTIRAMRAEGIAYRDQAILCRSHTSLARYAAGLEARDIPVLYLGDIFERPEVRDLLSLLSLAGESASSGLVRVAAFPDFTIPFSDVRAILAAGAAQGGSARETLDVPTAEPISATGQAGLAALCDLLVHIDGRRSAALALADFLFLRSRWLAPLVADDTVRGAQARLAIFQLLQAAQSYARTEPRGGVAGFLAWVRRLELLGDERQLRTPPTAAAGIDAVRLMTVHASKGLEFKAVHLPGLANGQFPASRRYDPCPPPPGLCHNTPDEVRLEEEQCLFFVALSRARDRLSLSRATHYGTARKPSPFLDTLAALLPRAPDAAPGWIGSAGAAPAHPPLTDCAQAPSEHRAEDLDQYMRCPRAYLYQRVLRLSGGRDDDGYVRFHRALYSVIRTLGEIGEAPEPHAAAQAALEASWSRIGPVGHPYEAVYRRQAELVLARAVERWIGARPEPAEWTVILGTGHILVRPDLVATQGGERHVHRLRTGRAPAAAPDDDLYALYHEGARQAGIAVSVGAHFLGSDKVVAVPMTPRVVSNRLAKYGAAIDGIASGEYPAAPDPRDCPRCPQFFVCPSPFA